MRYLVFWVGMALSMLLLGWGFIHLAVCDPAGEVYTGKWRLSFYENTDILTREREVEVASMCKFSGIQKRYKWVQEGGV